MMIRPQWLERSWQSNFRERLRTSFWLVPMLMTIGGLVLSLATVSIDRAGILPSAGVFWDGRADGARQLLGALAGSMITLAGIVFSVTIVVLTLAATQFGPRLLRRFMRDRGTQLVSGVFVGTFVYCVVTMGMIRGPEDGEFIPHLSVNVSLLLGVVSIGVFIYFVHHISASIRAETLISGIGRELVTAIQDLFPEEIGTSRAEQPAGEMEKYSGELAEEGTHIRSPRDGYIQAVEGAVLMDLAERHDAVFRLLYRPGDFVTEGVATIVARKQGGALSSRLTKEIAATLIIGNERTPTQDPEFAAHQMIQVALRALSPALNDPFTTIICIDWLGAGLSRLGQRNIPSIYRYGASRKLRVIAPTTTFADLADMSFNQIRQYGHRSVSVTLRMLETMAHVAEHVRRMEDRIVLGQHATLVHDDAMAAIPNARDRARVDELYQRAMTVIQDQLTLPASSLALAGGEGSDKA